MKVMVLGSGAKDHAVTWWFSRSRLIDGLYAAPGNVGTRSVAVNLPDVDPADPEAVYAACTAHGIDFVFVGTEAPLLTGVIDYLNKRGIDTFGAPGYALKLEDDRVFAREFMARHGIPFPAWHLIKSARYLGPYLKRNEGRKLVIKKKALSTSREILRSSDTEKLSAFAKTLLASGPVFIEEAVEGMPITVTILLDNNGYLALPYCSEYTKSEHGDASSATGGMGSICPIPLSEEVRSTIVSKIVRPTLDGMRAEGLSYKGVLTFSIVLAADGPVLVDYHVRFNDPAAQSFVPIVSNDLAELMEAIKTDSLGSCTLQTTGKSTVCVVIASEGYPENPVTGKTVNPIPSQKKYNVSRENPYIFFGAVKEQDGVMVTTGGRCASIVGHGQNIIQANSMAYAHIGDVTFEGSWYRSDIGNKFFEN
ncbi:MAG: phosphoribosylamine--glycine ligase [Spirochaetales bacterium]|nr:phosphoribosylamine--glycine ligase [Spirochaetales bacterium]